MVNLWKNSFAFPVETAGNRCLRQAVEKRLAHSANATSMNPQAGELPPAPDSNP